MKVSTIVTTYNWPEALSLVLAGLARQSVLPDEVIVADDGSGERTRRTLLDTARSFPTSLRHYWQDDTGFRAARARNGAIAAARGDYILFLDGDMVPHRHFVADHLRNARTGTFVQGSRALTSTVLAERMLQHKAIDLNPLSPQLMRRRNAVRSRFLSRLASTISTRLLRGIKTCNQGWFRSDLIRLNGFDERMIGWGREDAELAWRAWHAGIVPRHVRFEALAWHLYHPERHVNGESKNHGYLRETQRNGNTWADWGLDWHLARGRTLPDLRLLEME
jgi:glycosyltransferase involved in cell wall biosynthesis